MKTSTLISVAVRTEVKLDMKHHWLLPFVLVLGCPAGLLAQAKLEPVPIRLPAPGYEGTPPNFMNIPNMEKPSAKERAPFLAPAGVRNVARAYGRIRAASRSTAAGAFGESKKSCTNTHKGTGSSGLSRRHSPSCTRASSTASGWSG